MKKLFIILMFILTSFLYSCSNTQAGGDSLTSATLYETSDVIEIGDGVNSFTFTVTDNNNTVTEYLINTYEETVGNALQFLNLIEGEEGDFGLYINKVNGISADYEKDKAYWAFYIDGEYAQTGIDSTKIIKGETYALVYTKG